MSQAPPQVIVLAYANDRVDPARYLRNLVTEVRGIRNILQQTQGLPYQIVLIPNATLDEIIRVFDQYGRGVRVFHYAGHAGDVSLLLEAPGGTRQAADKTGLARLLASYGGLELVFLNGCDTLQLGDSLVEAGIPAVVVTDTAIEDETANLFAQRLYERLADRQPLVRAMADAEIKVQTLRGGAGLRALYLPEVESPTSFPWRLIGEGKNWRLLQDGPLTQGTITPLLCNRERQVELFRDVIETLSPEAFWQPPVFLLHGNRNERHRSLVERFQRAELRYFSERQYGVMRGIVQPYEVKDWPHAGDLGQRQRNLRRVLARAAGLTEITGADLTAPDIARLLKLQTGVHMFMHTLSAEKWDRDTLKLLQWYIQSFWRLPVQETAPLFVIFINIVYPDTARPGLIPWFQPRYRLRRQLFDLAERMPDRLVLLRELTPVPYTEVAEWVEEYYPDDLSALPDLIYEQDRTRALPMGVIEPQLRHEVDQLARRKAHREMFGST
ncbi:MAG: CHAT domain-containing protein [Bacteroidia bacterium]|nr:CHAT domain-containing protein [Bacteroidia bacterium]